MGFNCIVFTTHLLFNKRSLNVNKTKYMFFTQIIEKYNNDLKIDNCIIKREQTLISSDY